MKNIIHILQIKRLHKTIFQPYHGNLFFATIKEAEDFLLEKGFTRHSSGPKRRFFTTDTHYADIITLYRKLTRKKP